MILLRARARLTGRGPNGTGAAVTTDPFGMRISVFGLRPGIAGPAIVRDQFVGCVASAPHGRVLPRDFKPAKVIYAILLENGKQLTPDTLFPFSQATLAHAARILNTYGIKVEVIGVPAAP